jgi:hypothetical protein
MRLAACAGSITGCKKGDVDVHGLVHKQCLSLRNAELVLLVRWPMGDERLDQIVAATHENWELLRTALETGSDVVSSVPVRGGGAMKTTVSGPVRSVEAWVWDGAVHFADSELGIMDWMPASPPECKVGIGL